MLGAVPVFIGCNKEQTAMEMLKFAEQFVEIKAVLFDMGFYNAKLVKELEARNVYEHDWMMLTNMGCRNTKQLANLC